jgi:uncharacterized SAM-binding protein YcdF (DUF218 family)
MFSVLTNLLPNILFWMWLMAALFLWWATKGNGRARRLGVVLLVAFWLLGIRPVADVILYPLESQYAAPDIGSLQKQGVRQVVVLTGGGYRVSGEMLSSAFPHASTYRFIGGLELCSRLGPDCRLIFSGSAGRQRRDLATAITMKRLALNLMPGRQVLAEAQSGSTAEHPANVQPLVGNEPFVLVTSAVHMPRSMRTFHKASLTPIPYPVDFLSSGGPYGWSDWLPSAESLWKEGVALREYWALVFYSVKGW